MARVAGIGGIEGPGFGLRTPAAAEWAVRRGRLNWSGWYLAFFGGFHSRQFQKIDDLFQPARFRYALRV
jgi:hypothetical protein